MEWFCASASFAGLALFFNSQRKESARLNIALEDCPSALDRNSFDGATDRHFAFVEGVLRSTRPEQIMGVQVAASSVASYSVETETTTSRDKNAWPTTSDTYSALTHFSQHGDLRLEVVGLDKPLDIDRSLRGCFAHSFQTLSQATTANPSSVVNVNLAGAPEGRAVTGTHTLQVLRGLRDGEALTVVGDVSLTAGKVFPSRRLTLVSPRGMEELRTEASHASSSFATATAVCVVFGVLFGGIGASSWVKLPRAASDAA